MRLPCLRLQNVYGTPAERVREGGGGGRLLRIQVTEMVTWTIEWGKNEKLKKNP